MPKLTIVIGACCAGKSTWCERNRSKRLPAEFYNTKQVARALGDSNSRRNQQEAQRFVEHNIESSIRGKRDFGFVSTYSGVSRPGIARRAKAAGYETEAIFIGTSRPEINIERAARLAGDESKEDTGADEIRRQWATAQMNLAQTADSLDRIELVDSSGKKTQIAVQIQNGVRTGRASKAPCWADRMTEQVEKQGR